MKALFQMLFGLGLITIMAANCSSSADVSDKNSITRNTFKINLDPADCTVDIEQKLRTQSQYTETIDPQKGTRTIQINGVANHEVGQFPTRGNPNTIRVNAVSYTVPLNPTLARKTTYGQGWDTGVFFSGVGLEPFTAEFFVGSNGMINREWNITTLTDTENLGLDCNNAHVQPTGRYHYHGTPSAFLDELGVDGTQMVKIGYAADGFPMYYKYGYDEQGQLISHESGYQLKAGNRLGNGRTAPDGPFNGRYFQDYEYIATTSLLDECNGRWGKTPESDNEYYYVVTDNFPSIPLCFSGTPSQDFAKRRGAQGPPNGRRGQRPGGPPPGGRRPF
ncbi:MAG: YHYH protein [Bacteroidota bacterium]